MLSLYLCLAMLFYSYLDNVYQGFSDALRQVYGERLSPAQNRNMEYGLKFGHSRMDILVCFYSTHVVYVISFFCVAIITF
jgi:hypothetical protein